MLATVALSLVLSGSWMDHGRRRLADAVCDADVIVYGEALELTTLPSRGSGAPLGYLEVLGIRAERVLVGPPMERALVLLSPERKLISCGGPDPLPGERGLFFLVRSRDVERMTLSSREALTRELGVRAEETWSILAEALERNHDGRILLEDKSLAWPSDLTKWRWTDGNIIELRVDPRYAIEPLDVLVDREAVERRILDLHWAQRAVWLTLELDASIDGTRWSAEIEGTRAARLIRRHGGSTETCELRLHSVSWIRGDDTTSESGWLVVHDGASRRRFRVQPVADTVRFAPGERQVADLWLVTNRWLREAWSRQAPTFEPPPTWRDPSPSPCRR